MMLPWRSQRLHGSRILSLVYEVVRAPSLGIGSLAFHVHAAITRAIRTALEGKGPASSILEMVRVCERRQHITAHKLGTGTPPR
jgi:hypothetical protein